MCVINEFRGNKDTAQLSRKLLMQRKIKKAMDWILFNRCSIQIEINGREIGKEKRIGFLECNSTA